MRVVDGDVESLAAFQSLAENLSLSEMNPQTIHAWWRAARCAEHGSAVHFVLSTAREDGPDSDFVQLCAMFAIAHPQKALMLPRPAGLLGEMLRGVLLGRQGQLSACIHVLEEVAGRARLLVAECLLAWTLVELGRAHGMSGSSPASSKVLRESAALAARLQMPMVEQMAWGGIGMLYGQEGRSKEYVHYTRRALEIAQRSNNVYAEAHSRCNMAGGLVTMGHFDEAHRQYEQAQLLAAEHGIKRVEALALAGLGAFAFKRHDVDTGRTHLASAAYILSGLNDDYQIVWNDLVASKVLMQEGLLDNAMRYLSTARRRAEQRDLHSLCIREAEQRSVLLEHMGDLRGSLTASREALSLERQQFDRRLEDAARASQQAEQALNALKQASLERTRRQQLERTTQALQKALDEEACLRHLLEQTARTDVLTGIANRRAHEQHLPQLIADAARTQRSLVLFMADIDNFKDLNDRHGHHVGDAVLVAVAQRLQGATRISDHVARWGGEEFVVAALSTGANAATVLGQNLRRAIADQAVQTEVGALRVTVSIGAAIHCPGQESHTETMRRADLAMYRAKKLGRNGVVVDVDPPQTPKT